MTERISFTRYENAIYPRLRQKIQQAESTTDVKNSFAFAARELFSNAFQDKLSFRDDDIQLQPDKESRFVLSQRLLDSSTFNSVWEQSDLPRVIERFAGIAIGRVRRLEKHPEKTDAKIRM